MKLERLHIYHSDYPKPGHWKGTIEYKDDAGDSKIELTLSSKQVECIFPIIADRLVEISGQAAHLLRAEILGQQEKAEEPAA